MCMEISSIIKWSKQELKSGKGVICEMTRTVQTDRKGHYLKRGERWKDKSSHGEC